jgi:hypothetical protein
VKERVITLALAAGALALFWLLLFPKPRTAPDAAPRPLAAGVDAEGYFAAARWLATAGVPTLELHQRFDHLVDRTVSAKPSGNLLITTMPYAVVLNREELSDLDQWMDKGNTVLVLAALDDTPLWSGLAANFIPDLQKLTAIEFTAVRQPNKNLVTKVQDAATEVLTPACSAIELHPSGPIGLLEGVSKLATLSPLPSDQWQAKSMDAGPVLELARRTDSADPVLWIKGSGSGAIVISAYASLFSNHAIGKLDNARLLSNFVGWALQPGGRVIFDDGHQGTLDEYDAQKFFADPRLHHTLLWLLLLWLGWVVASQPLRAAPPHVVGLDESAMLRVTASFFAGVLRPVATAQWLLDEFFDRLRRRHGLAPSAGPPWEWLAAHAGLRGDALDELRELNARTQAGRRVSLVRLQQVLSQISGHIS